MVKRLLSRLNALSTPMLLLAVTFLAGWLSLRYDQQWDWTAAGSHTLSPASRQVLAAMEGPIEITAFVRDHKLSRERVRRLLAPYRRARPDLRVEMIDPDTVPGKVRELGIQREGELIVRYGGRSEHVSELTEQALTNTLQSLLRGGERWLAFLEGHGEQRPFGQANRDLGQFGQQLENRGLRAQGINLVKTGTVPDNTALLVIASPLVDLLPGEVEAVLDYVDRGGRLLWLLDPGPLHGLEPLAERLGITPVPGRPIDPTTAQLGIDQPTAVVINHYPDHPATRGFRYVTLLPEAVALEFRPTGEWQGVPLLVSASAAWSERGPLQGRVGFDPGQDVPGPLTLGLALTRGLEQGEQRVVVIGDGDFLSNTYLGNGGNLDLGLRLVNWLSGDASLVEVRPHTAPDRQLTLTRAQTLVIGIGFLLVMPLLFFGAGLVSWLRRRRA